MGEMPKNIEEYCTASFKLARKKNLTVMEAVRANICLAFSFAGASDNSANYYQFIMETAKELSLRAEDALRRAELEETNDIQP